MLFTHDIDYLQSKLSCNPPPMISRPLPDISPPLDGYAVSIQMICHVLVPDPFPDSSGRKSLTLPDEKSLPVRTPRWLVARSGSGARSHCLIHALHVMPQLLALVHTWIASGYSTDALVNVSLGTTFP